VSWLEIEVSARIREKSDRKRLTSDNELGPFWDEGILGVERAGGDLALPDAVIVLQAGVGDPERAVSGFGRGGPLVLLGVDADRDTVSLPTTLALLALDDAWQDDSALRVDLLVVRLLGPCLERDSQTWNAKKVEQN